MQITKFFLLRDFLNMKVNRPKFRTRLSMIEYRRKHHFGPYILGLQSIWSLHFGNNQFGLYYFQFTINLVSTINLLTENVYVENGLHS